MGEVRPRDRTFRTRPPVPVLGSVPIDPRSYPAHTIPASWTLRTVARAGLRTAWEEELVLEIARSSPSVGVLATWLGARPEPARSPIVLTVSRSGRIVLEVPGASATALERVDAIDLRYDDRDPPALELVFAQGEARVVLRERDVAEGTLELTRRVAEHAGLGLVADRWGRCAARRAPP